MPLRVHFRLLRRDDPAPAAAILLGSDDPAALLAACARLADPGVFPVAGGFLVVADSIPAGTPNAVRLRRLTENCFLPVDADLVPALLPAEAVDLTARRGLIFLPNRTPLAFDTARPLKPAAFLAIPRPRRDDWEPFPAGNPPAEQLTAIVRVMPEINPDELLEGAGPPVGTDDARPPSVGLGRGALGRASAGLGKGIGAIGKLVGSKKLSELGGKLAGLGAAMAPRITEGLLGKQEAALQHLLKKFREGKTDEALRHSVPIGNEVGRGSQIHASARLPTHSLFWSLAGLFGAGRPGSVWAGGNPETWRDLIAEYRKAAQQAADRGDFRRAALIYARLLSDFRAAGEVLARGGLHRPAALLFRDKVRDPGRAAREFEQAGEHDEALRLYRDANLNLEAGDLLRRLGEEEQAIEEYHRAADRVVQLRQDHVEAGDILLRKTGRADLAGAYFARGWEDRSKSQGLSRNATACAERLIEIYAFADPRDSFWDLLGEAERWLAQPGSAHDTARFFAKVGRFADLPHLRTDRPEIRNRCRLGLAGKLREHAKYEPNPGTAVGDIFGASQQWSPAVVSDAEFALRAALKMRRPDDRPADGRVRLQTLHTGPVTSAVVAPDHGTLFVGFRDGTLVRYDPSAGHTSTLSSGYGWPVVGIATDPGGEAVAMLRGAGPEVTAPEEAYGRLELLSRHGTEFREQARAYVPLRGLSGLLPVIEDFEGARAVGVSTMSGVFWFQLPGLTERARIGATNPVPATTHLKLRIGGPNGELFTFEGGSVSFGGSRTYVGWMPDEPPGSTLFTPPVAWLEVRLAHIELAGLFDQATLYWTRVVQHPDHRLDTQTLTYVTPGGFRAACIWRPGQVIGVSTRNRVLWIKVKAGRFAEWAAPVEVETPARAVACFPSRATNEVLVIFKDGTLARVPVPQ